MKFENPAMMLVFSVTTLGTNTSVPFTCPAEGSDGVISSMRRRPLLLCLAAGLAKHTATNAVQTNQVDMRTEEMRTLCLRLICIVQCGQRHEARWRLQI